MNRAERFFPGIEMGSRVDVVDQLNADQDELETSDAHFESLAYDWDDSPFYHLVDCGPSDDRNFEMGPIFDESDYYDSVGF